MKASHSLIAMALAGTPLTLAVADETESAALSSNSAISASLFCESNLLPGPANVFLGNRTLSPLALLSGSTDAPAFDDTALGHPFLLDECNAAPGAVNLVMFGGGGEAVGLTRREGRANENAMHMAMKGITFGNATPPAAGGGGGSAGGASGGGGNSNGAGNAGNNSNQGGGNTGGGNAGGGPPTAPNPPAPPAGGGTSNGNGSSPGTNTLVEWNILPPGNGSGSDTSDTPMHDSGVGSAPMPLPAPVWMALAGLTLVVAFRRRLMP